jgi:hypothetical protein
MARVGRVQSMISRWYCSAAFLTSCILGNRCSTSIRGKDNNFCNLLLLFKMDRLPSGERRAKF